MPRLQRKALTTPDLVRTFPHGRVDIVNLDETYIARLTWEPGWRWSTDVAPIVQTTSCQNRHLGYALSGSLRVVMGQRPGAFTCARLSRMSRLI